MNRPNSARGRVLLVEGIDDKHVLWALLAANEDKIPDKSFEIEDCGGDTRALDNLRVRLKANNDTHLGIVLDADDNLEVRWRSLRHLIGVLPKEPVADGLVLQLSEGPRLGIWLMPDNKLPGRLENFVSFLVPNGDELWVMATQYVAAARREGAQFPTQHETKATVHAWLAVQPEPGKPMGQAITARYLDSSAEVVNGLLAWLERLFLTPDKHQAPTSP